MHAEEPADLTRIGNVRAHLGKPAGKRLRAARPNLSLVRLARCAENDLARNRPVRMSAPGPSGKRRIAHLHLSQMPRTRISASLATLRHAAFAAVSIRAYSSAVSLSPIILSGFFTAPRLLRFRMATS